MHLDAAGYKVFAGVRRGEDGERLRAECSRLLAPVVLDVTSADSIAAAAAELGEKQPLVGLINNAGIAVAGPVELLPVAMWRRQLEVNVLGLVAVTQAFLPHLRQVRGRVINIGSIAGRSSLPCAGPYSASKFAVEAISDSLRMELHAWGMHVCVIEPGAVATAIWEKSLEAADALAGQTDAAKYGLYRSLVERVRAKAAEAGERAAPVSDVVQAVMAALTSAAPKTRYVVGRDAKLRLLLNMLPDRLRDKLILKAVMGGK